LHKIQNLIIRVVVSKSVWVELCVGEGNPRFFRFQRTYAVRDEKEDLEKILTHLIAVKCVFCTVA